MRLIVRYSVIFFASIFIYSQANSASRIKDIVYFEGIRDNILVGYGLVVGLDGTGDNLKNAPFTEAGLASFLGKVGVNTKGTSLKTKNAAAVTVTSTLPAFSRNGSRIDVFVSTLGDAKSLQGGTLLASPLHGADGHVYAVAQGPISIGELITNKRSSNASNKSVPTNGFVSNGAIIEKELDFSLGSLKQIKLALRNPDISTSRRISENINELLGDDVAMAMDPGTVEVSIPDLYEDNIVGLLADIEAIVVEPDRPAKIVIDESSGTIVMGEDVRIDTIAVAQGNLLVTINSNEASGDDYGFSSDRAASAKKNSQVSSNNEHGNGLAIIRQGANLRDLVSGLNALGVGTRDLITILQTIKTAGALYSEIEVR